MVDFVDIEPIVDKTECFKPIFDPLAEYDDYELYKNYRFDRDSILWIADLLRPSLERETSQNRPLPAEVQTQITFRRNIRLVLP